MWAGKRTNGTCYLVKIMAFDFSGVAVKKQSRNIVERQRRAELRSSIARPKNNGYNEKMLNI